MRQSPNTQQAHWTFPPPPVYNPKGVSHISPVVATLRRFASLPWVNRLAGFRNPESGCIITFSGNLVTLQPCSDSLVTFYISAFTHHASRITLQRSNAP